MRIRVVDVPQWGWKPLPMRGCIGVLARVLLFSKDLVVIMVKLEVEGSLCEQASPYAIDVVCLEGLGGTSVRDSSRLEIMDLHAGQSVRWPADVLHRLWAVEEPLTALLIEHVGNRDGG